MGKKGKRSKQKDAKKEADKIIRESDILMNGALDDLEKALFSTGVSQIKQAIRLLESKKELIVYTREEQINVFCTLMTSEYRRWNYKAAIDCYNYIKANPRHGHPTFRSTASLYYQLIMLRLSGQECQLSDFIHYILHEDRDLVFYALIFTDAVLAFRAHKQFDSAIRLEMTIQSQTRSTTLKRKLSLALTYLEQYRVDFHKRSEMRNEDIGRINDLIDSLMTEYPPDGNFSSYGSSEYCLVLAQWYYLICNQAIAYGKNSKQTSIIMATKMVGVFIYRSSKKVSSERWEIKMSNCCTCDQAVTSTEVQYLCSGCRVVCYCSIDHQRMTWKKEAVMGMHIGHEILCPLYKVCRKYTRARDLKDEEKESRMKRRYDRECLKFLEYGLGLKNKRFPLEKQM
ncbi:predicted protein [Chaetoceros tenuissimus]|uniref:MYND-type domain-containing protein n=1 Tax=Chaetoceros tenuissimus TaxID=426638 RepID=A0AAD3HAJ4_9STRA|nr:predicted protein [Chaetoceros tenuissimus]